MRYCLSVIQTILLSLVVLNFLGCSSSSGSDNTNSNTDAEFGIPKINITDLSLQNDTYYEGDVVLLSLNTQASNLSNITYAWKVQHNGQALPFTGNNTDTIEFTAPDVTAMDSVSVSVEIGLKNGEILGDSRSSTSIFVKDLNQSTSHPLTEKAFTTTLPSVNALDPSVLANSTAIFSNYEKGFIDVEGETVFEQLEKRYTAHFDQNSNFKTCGDDTSLSVLDVDLLDYISAECDGSLSTAYYQNEKILRLETLCDNEIVKVSEFTQISPDPNYSVGSIKATFTNYTDIDTSEGVCANEVNAVHTVMLENDEGRVVPYNDETSAVLFSAPYINGNLSFLISLPRIPDWRAMHSLGIGSVDTGVALTLLSSDISELNNHTTINLAYEIRKGVDDILDIETTANFRTLSGDIEVVEIEAALNLNASTE